MGVWTKRAAKGLGDGDDSGTGFGVADGFGHQLLDRLISEPRQISEQLPVIQEVGSEHLWHGERPETMANVFE